MENAPDAQLDFSDEELNRILDEVEQWYARFADTGQYQRLSGYAHLVGASVILYFAEYLYTHVGQAPQEWTPGGVEEVCMRVMPSKIAAGPEFFSAAPDVLTAFLDYTQEAGLLAQAPALRKRVQQMATDMLAAAEDEANWSMSKVVGMMALKAGVDLEDEDQMRHFMQMMNIRFEEQAWQVQKSKDADGKAGADEA